MSGDAAAYDQKARRIKQLLSSYYGTEQHHDAETNSQLSGGPTDEVSSSTSLGTPMYSSIDSPAFNVDTYVHALVRTARIDTLLKKHADMVKEIRALDSDMQMLVYENYNKFISATDTIRSMKSNVDGMGEKMEELRVIMDRVAQTSDGVNSKLQKHRDGIEELSRVKALLQKIQCVIDLPKRMTIAVNEGAFSVVVSNYCEAKPLLKKYGHQGAFRSVAADCEAIIEDVTNKLEEKLRNPKGDAEESVRLLRQLGAEPEKLQELFLSGCRCQIEDVMTEAASLLSSMAHMFLDPEVSIDVGSEWREEQAETVTVGSFIQTLNARTLNLLCESAADFNSTFSAAGQETDAPLDRSHLVSAATAVMDAYKEYTGQALALAAIQGAAEALELSATGALYSSMTSNDDDDSPWTSVSIGSDFGTCEIAKCLSYIIRDLSVVECRLPELEPAALSLVLSQNCVEYHTSMCLRALAQKVIGTLVSIKRRTFDTQMSSGSILREFGMSDLQRIYAHLCDLLLKGLSSVLEDLKNYQTHLQHMESSLGAFIDALQGQIQQLFMTLLDAFAQLVKVRNPEDEAEDGIFAEVARGIGQTPLPEQLKEQTLCGLAQFSPPAQSKAADEDSKRHRHRAKCPSGLVLLCARLCTFLEITLVPHAVEIIASLFPDGGINDQPAFNPSEVIRKANTCAADLLRAYIELYCRSLTVMIRQSIAAANWLNHKEPRGPRPICDLIITRLETSEKEIVQLVDDGGNRSRRKLMSSPQHTRDASTASVEASETSEGTVLERNVAKLFRERVQLGKKAEFTQSSIQAAILGGGLKSLIECIRMETLGRAGLQQLQLDVLYLRSLVTGFVRGRESETIAALLEEVIAAAVERSLDPTLLEPTVVDKILMAGNE